MANEDTALMALDTDAPECCPQVVAAAVQNLFGLTGTLDPRRGERDLNFHLRTADGDQFIVKISHPSEDHLVVDLQNQALQHIKIQDPDLPVPRLVMSVNGRPVETMSGAGDERLMIRVMSYLPGETLWNVPRTPELLRQVGAASARLDRALQGFFHPAANQKIAWDLMNVAALSPYVDLIGGKAERDLAEQALNDFLSASHPSLIGMRSQIIHNDLNLGNVLVSSSDQHSVTGLIDFGDMLHAPLVLELAVAGADIVLDTDDPVAALEPLIAGYESVLPLAGEERAELYNAIRARLAMTVAIYAWRQRNNANLNEDAARDLVAYLSPTNEALAKLAEAHKAASDAGFAHRSHHSVGQAAENIKHLRALREKHLGPGLKLFYSDPLHIVRGDGVWLYDSSGKAYLDGYNNVAHVGHCHPHVVASITKQAAILNTNTRYLHETILTYCERLTARLPAGLDVCVFVNSGSEANDIAWRMAKAFTGHSGALIVENAYHGGTDAVVALSPEEFDDAPLPAHVRALDSPDTYRGRWRTDHERPGEAYAAQTDQALAELSAAGHDPAIFILDTGTSSNGILDIPDGYLPAVVDKVHAAGALFIADEVQFGFARSGSHFWGFDLLGATPDIVTLGKPIGNGHPIGLIITRPEILTAFMADAGYFSTFGGNPVSAAAATAVLDVLERENLQQNAIDTGRYLRKCLRELASTHPIIGEVRGHGLLIGVDLVDDPATRHPASAATVQVLDHMRGNGVLVGKTGPHSNVLKIRPPMSFSRANADQLVDALAKALADLPGRA